MFNAGARPQRLLMASTGTKDPKLSDILYIQSLAAPLTVNTMPEATLKAFADHGQIGPLLSADGGDCEAVLKMFREAGIDIDALAARLQDEGAKSFVKSWNDLLECIASKGEMLRKSGLNRAGRARLLPSRKCGESVPRFARLGGSLALPAIPPELLREALMQVLVVDVGGTHVKILVSGNETPRKFDSGPTMTAEQMVAGVLRAADGWNFERRSRSDIPARCFVVGRLRNRTTSGAVGSVSTTRRPSAAPSNSLTTPPCKPWEVAKAGRCFSSAWERGSVRR